MKVNFNEEFLASQKASSAEKEETIVGTTINIPAVVRQAMYQDWRKAEDELDQFCGWDDDSEYANKEDEYANKILNLREEYAEKAAAYEKEESEKARKTIEKKRYIIGIIIGVGLAIVLEYLLNSRHDISSILTSVFSYALIAAIAVTVINIVRRSNKSGDTQQTYKSRLEEAEKETLKNDNPIIEEYKEKRLALKEQWEPLLRDLLLGKKKRENEKLQNKEKLNELKEIANDKRNVFYSSTPFYLISETDTMNVVDTLHMMYKFRDDETKSIDDILQEFMAGLQEDIPELTEGYEKINDLLTSTFGDSVAKQFGNQ